jgi:hypothetical protein
VVCALRAKMLNPRHESGVLHTGHIETSSPDRHMQRYGSTIVTMWTAGNET